MHATIDFETYSEAGFEWSPALNKWVPPEGGSLCVEASTLNGIITLCIENKVPKAGLPDILRRVLEAEGIPVLEAQALDE